MAEDINGRHLTETRQQRQRRVPGIARRQQNLSAFPLSHNSAINGRSRVPLSDTVLLPSPSQTVRSQSSHGSASTSSANIGERLSAQELVRLDHPRPNLLRAKNEYVTVPACSDLTLLSTPASRNSNQRRSRETTGRKASRNGAFNVDRTKLSSPSNLDRQKVHLASSQTVRNPEAERDARRLGAIRPLVRTAGPPQDCRPPLLPVKHRTVDSKRKEFGAPIPVNNLRLCRSSEKQVLGHTTGISSQPSTLLVKRSDSVNNPPSTRVYLPRSEIGGSAPSSLVGSGDSITCRSCGRCRCSACSVPKELPSAIVCENGCLISADSVVDAVSCMCCVRGCLYHFGGGSGDDSRGPPRLSDSDLCSCDSPGCCVRWTCLTGALVCLPCTWCYLPLKGCAALAELCYSKMSNRGCQCEGEHYPDLCRPDLSSRRNFAAPITDQPKGKALSPCDAQVW